MRSTILYILIVLLAASPICAGFTRIQNQQSVIEMPFSFEHKLVFVKAKVNGQGPFNMLLDTGSDISAINLSVAREIGLPLGTKGQQAQGAGTDKTQFYKTRFAQVEVGDLVVRNISAGAIDLSKISQALGITLDGVLGYNFLQDRVIQIDYPKRVLRFYSNAPVSVSDQQQNTERRVMLPFKQPEFGPVIDEVYINGQKVRTAIDTGSGDIFKLTPEAIKSLGVEAEANAGEVVRGMGFNGETQNKSGKIKSLRIGTITLEEPTVTFFAKGPQPGAIGGGFMQDYVVTLDYHRKLITFERP